MIFIHKGHEPIGLRQYKKDLGKKATYKEFAETETYKDGFAELRISLIAEQKGLCAYCMQKIEFKDKNTGKVKMKTEHFEPKGGTPAQQALQLTYTNLLACCMGNTGNVKNKEKTHCDSYKGNTTLQYIPNPKLGKFKDFRRPLFKYKVKERSEEVIVYSIDKNINQEINKVLNLNGQVLRSKRFLAWKSIMKFIQNKDKKTLNIKRAKQIFESYQPDSSKQEYKAFCDFICYWLEKRFRKEFENFKR